MDIQGSDGGGLGRGATRGMRDRREMMSKAKPDNIVSKQGSGGESILLRTN